MFVHDQLRASLLESRGLVSRRSKPDLEDLRETEWSPAFEALMRQRLIMGALRYGLLHERGKPQYDRVASAEIRLKLYRTTGNQEILADVANMMLLEFEEGVHPLKHFHGADGGHHTEVKK